MHLVKVTTDDIDMLLRISAKTFHDAFHHLNTVANMEAYMGKAFTRQKLLEELSDVNSSFYFACDGDVIAGYIKINQGKAQTEFKDDVSLEIERIYVDAPYQGKGVGALLLAKAKEMAGELGKKYIWLGVWEKNPGAISFYMRHGFNVFSEHEFQMGDEVQIDKLMICMLYENRGT